MQKELVANTTDLYSMMGAVFDCGGASTGPPSSQQARKAWFLSSRDAGVPKAGEAFACVQGSRRNRPTVGQCLGKPDRAHNAGSACNQRFL